MKQWVLRWILCSLVLAASNGCLVDAQVLYGSLTGNVTDPTGAPVPGAHIEAVNQATNVKSDADSDVHGVYRFTELQGGFY
jgi:protocatechuate 3,4-dioxygenase beta subunit